MGSVAPPGLFPEQLPVGTLNPGISLAHNSSSPKAIRSQGVTFYTVLPVSTLFSFLFCIFSSITLDLLQVSDLFSVLVIFYKQYNELIITGKKSFELQFL